jgi:hypothetical protein
MICRIIVDECPSGVPSGERRLGGLVNSHLLGGVIVRLGTHPPKRFDSRRARFCLTEAGWQQAGRMIAVEARQRGHVVRVIRRKEPEGSQVVFREELQPAMPNSRRARRK